MFSYNWTLSPQKKIYIILIHQSKFQNIFHYFIQINGIYFQNEIDLIKKIFKFPMKVNAQFESK